MERQAKDYTIGWISSTDFELAAAVAMFDEEHASLRVPPQDSNRYKLGRVQGHNIIMASLPRGFYGPTSAAITARDMLRSFPAIRFCLLVGVGAGVPSADRDIRLGDVVVSYPNNSSGGVIQFDLGTVTSQGVAPSEAGNVKQPPPDILLSAVNSLQAKFRMEKSRRRRFIKEAHEKYPNMGDCFSFPGRSQDLLFQATYHHPLGNVDCSSCDKSCLVIRSDRDDEIPVIHYGTIASSQSVIKDATFRDKFGKDLGAICFEMEAAGVMSALPSIVIKGIVDYADSHRGKDWHSYAALAAAAYSKELLSVLPADTSDRMSAAAGLLDPDLFDDHLVSQDLDFPDTVSQTSTLIESLDEGIVTTAIMEVAHVLATKGRLRALCTAAVMRVGPFRLQSILLLALTGFSKALKKNAQTPVGRGMRWLFSRYRPLIATYVTEDICKQDHVSGSLGLSRDEAPSIPADRLLETINERFSETKTPAIAPHKDSLNSIQNTVMSGVTTQVVDEDIDLDILDLPGSSLADLRQLNQALCEGEWFEDMLENLEALLLPPIAKVIARILERHIFSTTETSVVNCSVEWELLSYARSDDLSVDEIDTIFILVGDFDHAYAISLGRYMSETWKTGKEVLEVVKAAIANAFNDGTSSISGPEHLDQYRSSFWDVGILELKAICSCYPVFMFSADPLKHSF